MNIQRVRNLTTGRLHTNMNDIYEDIEYLTDEKGVMTHMLPYAVKALQVYLKNKIKDPRFWDGKYDTSHVGDIELLPMSKDEKSKFFDSF